MIVVCDVNEIWRAKPFAALAKKTELLGVAPADWMVARHRRSLALDMETLPVVLPPGWASRTAWLGQRLLWHKIKARAGAVETLILTSPHYLPLLDFIPPSTRIIYYASDDYRSYEGWGCVAELEQEIVRRADHSFFVSKGLMRRAASEYEVDPDKLSVSMNATERRFFSNAETRSAQSVVKENKNSQRLCVEKICGNKLALPIAGVIGGINDRLDFDLLLQCAELPALGTLLLVGPLPAEPSGALKTLLSHPKCVAVGRQPHDTIHAWFQCLDVGLIPYVESELNRYCSPMRLFDHLASGAPIVATDACDQVGEYIETFADAVFVEALRTRLGQPAARVEGITWDDRAAEMLSVMETLTHA